MLFVFNSFITKIWDHAIALISIPILILCSFVIKHHLSKLNFFKHVAEKNNLIQLLSYSAHIFIINIVVIVLIPILDKININTAFLVLFSEIWFTYYIASTISFMIQKICIYNNLKEILTDGANILIWGSSIIRWIGLQEDISSKLNFISIQMGNAEITLQGIIQAVAILFLAIITALFIWSIIEYYLRNKNIDQTIFLGINRIGKFSISSLFIIIVLPYVGFDLASISIFFGAFAVGIGFGFQKIASSYISGIILLLEGSIHIGDLVKVENHTGIVETLTSRYTLLILLDGTAITIPNDKMVSAIVINCSHVTENIKYSIKVLVPYVLEMPIMLEKIKETVLSFSYVTPADKLFIYIDEYQTSGALVGIFFPISDAKIGRLEVHNAVHEVVLNAFIATGQTPSSYHIVNNKV